MKNRQKLLNMIETLDDASIAKVLELTQSLTENQSTDEPELENELYDRFIKDWVNLQDALDDVYHILICKKEFIDIVDGKADDLTRRERHLNILNKLLGAVHSLIFLLQYHDRDRIEFDISEGFEFRSGSFQISFNFF